MPDSAQIAKATWEPKPGKEDPTNTVQLMSALTKTPQLSLTSTPPPAFANNAQADSSPTQKILEESEPNA